MPTVNARRFATTSDVVNFGNADLCGANLFAFSLHFRAAFDAAAINTAAGTNYNLISQWGPSNSDQLLRIRKNGLGLLATLQYSTWVMNLTVADLGLFPNSVPDTTWHSYVYTWSTTNQGGSFYKDGVLLPSTGSGNIGYVVKPSGSFIIGNHANVGAPPPGVAICDVGFWKTELTPGQAQALALGTRSQNVQIGSLRTVIPLMGAASPEVSFTGVALSGTVTGTTVVTGPNIAAINAVVLTSNPPTTNLPTPVTITASWGTGGVGGTATLTWNVPTGTLSPSTAVLANTVGATQNFTFTPADDSPSSVTLTCHNNIGLGDSFVTVTVLPPVLQIKTARILDSGKSLLLQFGDGNNADVDITDFPILPTIRINGGSPLTPDGVLWQNPLGTNGYRLNGDRTNRAFLSLPMTPRQVVVVDDETPTNFVATGTWSLVQAGQFEVATGYSNSYHQTSVVTDTASWQMTGLVAGRSYNVYVTWWAGTDRTSAATYKVHDATVTGTVLASKVFDQRFGPAKTEPFYASNNMVWQLIDDVIPTGTILFVTVENTAGTGKLIADATLVEANRVFTKVQEGDVVTLSAAPGFAESAAGSCRSYTDFPVTNLVGGSILPQFQMTKKKMGTGYNLGPVSYYECGNYYRNCYKTATGGWSTGFGTITKDSGGNLVSINSPGIDASIIMRTPGQPTGTTGPYWVLPYHCDGTWTISYKGPSGPLPLGSLSISVSAPSTSTLLSETIVNGRNIALYRVLAGPNQPSASVSLRATSIPAHDIIVYEPDVEFYSPITKRSDVSIGPDPLDPTNLWQKWFIDKLKGSQVTRFVGPMHVDVCSTQYWADFNHGTEDFVTPNWPHWTSKAIESLRPVDLTGADVDGAQKLFSQQAAIAVTFATPHAFRDGDDIQLTGIGRGYSFPVAPTTYGTGNMHLDGPVGNPAFVKDANTILLCPYKDGSIAIPYGSNAIVTLDRIWTPPVGESWTAYAVKNNAMPPEHVVDICNKANTDAWMTVPLMATNDCAYQMGLMCGNNLANGHICNIEIANEVWNFSYIEKVYCDAKARQQTALYNSSGGTQGVNVNSNSNKYYAFRVGQISAQFKLGWLAAGRNAADLKVMVGCGGDYFNVAKDAIDYMYLNNIHFDIVVVAEYAQNMPIEIGFSGYQDEVLPMIANLDKDHLIDLYKITILYGNYDKVYKNLYGILANKTSYPPNAYATLDANGAWVSGNRVIIYEQAIDIFVPAYTDQARKSHQCILDPEARNLGLAFLQAKENYGVAASVKEELAFDRGWPAGLPWSDYVSIFTKSGLGDGSDGLFDNRPNPESPYVTGVMAGVQKTWNSLLTAPVSLGARHFVAATDVVNFGNADICGGNLLGLSVHFRAKFDSAAINTTSGVIYNLISQWGNVGTAQLFKIWKNGLSFKATIAYATWIMNLTVADIGLFPSSVADTNWHSYLFTWSTTNQPGSFYKDGVLLTTTGSGNIGYVIKPTSNLLIGNNPDVGPPPPGISICDVGFWTDELTLNDAQALSFGYKSKYFGGSTLRTAIPLSGSTIPETSNAGVSFSGTVTGTTGVPGPSLYDMGLTTSKNVVVSTKVLTAQGTGSTSSTLAKINILSTAIILIGGTSGTVTATLQKANVVGLTLEPRTQIVTNLARHFANSTDAVNFGNADLCGGNTFAFSVHFRAAFDDNAINTAGGTSYNLISQWGSTTSTQFLLIKKVGLSLVASLKYSTWVMNMTVSDMGLFPDSVPDIDWHSYLFTWSTSNQAGSFYRDGVQLASTGSGNIGYLFRPSTTNFLIGNNTSVGVAPPGVAICDLATWTSALTSADAAILATGLRARYVKSGTLKVSLPLAVTSSPELPDAGLALSGTVTGTSAVGGPPLFDPTVYPKIVVAVGATNLVGVVSGDLVSTLATATCSVSTPPVTVAFSGDYTVALDTANIAVPCSDFTLVEIALDARQFTPTTDVVNFGNADLCNGNMLAFSVHFRAKFDVAAINTTPGTVYNLISQWGSTSAAQLFKLTKNGLSFVARIQYSTWIMNITVADMGLFPASVPDTNWHSYLFTWSTTNQPGSFYRDGVQLVSTGSGNIGYVIKPTGNLLIGKDANVGNPPPGVAFCDIAFWTIALNVTDAQLLATGAKAKYVRPSSLRTSIPLNSHAAPELSDAGISLSGAVTGTTAVPGPLIFDYALLPSIGVAAATRLPVMVGSGNVPRVLSTVNIGANVTGVLGSASGSLSQTLDTAAVTLGEIDLGYQISGDISVPLGTNSIAVAATSLTSTATGDVTNALTSTTIPVISLVPAGILTGSSTVTLDTVEIAVGATDIPGFSETFLPATGIATNARALSGAISGVGSGILVSLGSMSFSSSLSSVASAGLPAIFVSVNATPLSFTGDMVFPIPAISVLVGAPSLGGSVGLVQVLTTSNIGIIAIEITGLASGSVSRPFAQNPISVTARPVVTSVGTVSLALGQANVAGTGITISGFSPVMLPFTGISVKGVPLPGNPEGAVTFALSKALVSSVLTQILGGTSGTFATTLDTASVATGCRDLETSIIGLAQQPLAKIVIISSGVPLEASGSGDIERTAASLTPLVVARTLQGKADGSVFVTLDIADVAISQVAPDPALVQKLESINIDSEGLDPSGVGTGDAIMGMILSDIASSAISPAHYDTILGSKGGMGGISGARVGSMMDIGTAMSEGGARLS